MRFSFVPWPRAHPKPHNAHIHPLERYWSIWVLVGFFNSILWFPFNGFVGWQIPILLNSCQKFCVPPPFPHIFKYCDIRIKTTSMKGVQKSWSGINHWHVSFDSRHGKTKKYFSLINLQLFYSGNGLETTYNYYIWGACLDQTLIA